MARDMRCGGVLAVVLSLTMAPVVLPSVAFAQAIDPSVIQNLQRQLGAGNSQMSQQTPEPGDSEQGSEPQVSSLAGGRVDTTEEQELRRAQARRDLATMYQPSAIEMDYRRRTGDRDLRQFGYDFLQSARPPSGTRSGAIGDDYVLGIGDEVQVSFRGASNNSFNAVVDRDGRIVVGQLRPIQAAGRSLGAVRAEIAAETKRTMLATDAFVSVGNVRSISVFVGGEVARPGQINLNSMADVGTALSLAGGVRRSGSLRQVRIVRAGGGTVLADLYGLFGIGAPPAIRLRDGDRIIVPVIGPTVAVTGAVARPGIYELKGQSSVGSVVAYAGGAIRQRGGQVVVSRISPDGSEVFERAAVAGSRIIGGDAVQVVGGSAGGAQGRVELLGNVDNPGPRPLVAASTIADLVGRQEDLRSDTYQAAAVLKRRDPATGARTYEVVNLAQQLRQRPSLALQSEDQLYIVSRADIAFLNSGPVRRIILGQRNILPDCKALSSLQALVKDTDGARFNAVTRGNFVIQTEKGAELGSAQVKQTTRRMGTSNNNNNGNIGGPNAGNSNNNDSALGINNDDVKPECSAIFEQAPDILPILLEHSVSVGGAVRRPGAYPLGGTASARDLSVLADGTLVGASRMVLDIIRADSGVSERVQIDGDANRSMALTSFSAGDDVRFNAQQPVFEASAVLLSGEVVRPGLYSIRKGEKLSELLVRAGGLTSYSYAYGTVFTRVSVREAQEEGFRRTARELNNSLLAVAARSEKGSAEGIAGAATLVQALSQTEATGRMVVEADPRVLELRPDLDTVLEPGDQITVPKRPNFVVVLGDVNNPGALQFVQGKNTGTYLREAGGTLATADNGRAFLVLPNGTAGPLRGGGWGGGGGAVPPPGSTIIVPKNIDPLYKLTVIRDITAIVAQLATSVATVAVLANN